MTDEEKQQEQVPPEQQITSAEDMLPSYLRTGKLTFSDFKKHLSGPLISTVIHIVILIIAGTAIIMEPPPKEIEEIKVEMVQVKPIPPPPPPPPEPVQENVEIQNPTDAPIERPTIQTETVSLAPTVEAVSTGSEQADVPAPSVNLSVSPSNSSLKMPGLMASRTAGGIKSSLKIYGGTMKGEKSVLEGLRWLAKVQNEDGSWGETGDMAAKVALTSVATLSFLAHGETPQSADFGDTVLRALKRLSAWADAASPTGSSYGNGYSHAMLTYAISEGYAMTKIPMLERSMNKLVNALVQGQNDFGGFDYGFAKNPATIDPKSGQCTLAGAKVGDFRCDLSVAGWCYQALKAAYAAGCSVDGLPKAIDKACKCIRTVNLVKAGGFAYSNHGTPSISMSSVGTLCLQLFGEGRTREAQNGLKYIEEYKVAADQEPLNMNWKVVGTGAGNMSSMPLYSWYYMTQAIFQGHSGKGKVWDRWNKSFREELNKEQSREGYWDSPTAKYQKPQKTENGMTRPDLGDGGLGTFGTVTGQRVWSTSMCCLMLEVYYRFLPTFKTTQTHEAVKSDSDEKEDEDDISL